MELVKSGGSKNIQGGQYKTYEYHGGQSKMKENIEDEEEQYTKCEFQGGQNKLKVSIFTQWLIYFPLNLRSWYKFLYF